MLAGELMGAERRRTLLCLAAVLALAALMRLRGIGWGLPALYEPDEPFFMLLGLRLLREHTLDPAWFGHPGGTTIYMLALIDLATFGLGRLSGRFPDVAAFVAAIYHDPGTIVAPSRAAFLLFGVANVALTFRLGQRLLGARCGLIAGLLLAVDPLHIRYSQIIRTDVQMSVFMLAGLLAAVAIAERGRTRHYLLAGFWIGLACATKWPGAAALIAVAGAGLLRARSGDPLAAVAVRLVGAGVAALGGLFLGSPFVFIDYATVLANVRIERRAEHPGATGFGTLGNAAWYVRHALFDALGAAGLALLPIGAGVAAVRSRAFGFALLPMVLLLFAAICSLSLVWERWMIPLLPFATIAIAAAIDAAGARLGRRAGDRAGRAIAAALTLLVAVPLLVAADRDARERATDTRELASAWARGHVAPGSTVLVEYLAFDLVDADWRFLFPIGQAGCVDALAQLRGGMKLDTARAWKGSRNVVDVGTLEPATIPGCGTADYAMLASLDRYRAAPAASAAELANYRALLRGAHLVARFVPRGGEVGGPPVYIFRLAGTRPPAVRP